MKLEISNKILHIYDEHWVKYGQKVVRTDQYKVIDTCFQMPGLFVVVTKDSKYHQHQNAWTFCVFSILLFVFIFIFFIFFLTSQLLMWSIWCHKVSLQVKSKNRNDRNLCLNTKYKERILVAEKENEYKLKKEIKKDLLMGKKDLHTFMKPKTFQTKNDK